MELAKKMSEKSKRSGMMTTRAMRDLETLRNQRVYKECLIRVQFPCRLVVEAVFRPTETFNDVALVLKRAVLTPDASQAEFYFFTAPPKRVVEGDATLKSSGCTPAALIYLGWASGTAPVDVSSLCRSDFVAGDVAASPGASFPTSVKIDGGSRGSSVDQYGSAASRSSSNRGAGGRKGRGARAGGKPSWLKL